MERTRYHLIQRAVTLALTGMYDGAASVKAQLVREGYTDGKGQVFRWQFRERLERICVRAQQRNQWEF